jgi:hypothetical protein
LTRPYGRCDDGHRLTRLTRLTLAAGDAGIAYSKNRAAIRQLAE